MAVTNKTRTEPTLRAPSVTPQRTINQTRPEISPTEILPGGGRPVSEADSHKWSKEEAVALWKDEPFDTTQPDAAQTASDAAVAETIATENVDKKATLSLFQYWVELAQQHIYEEIVRNPGDAARRWEEVLFISLNSDYLPGEMRIDPLARLARTTEEQAKEFLDGLRSWAEEEPKGRALSVIGWLVQRPDNSGLLLCWDKWIPQVRYLQYWEQSEEASILMVNSDGNLTLRIYPADREQDPYDVNYTVQGYEADGLERGDRVRYWQNLEGRPFMFPQTPLSPYAEQRKAEWSRVDEDIYTSDPLPVG